MTPRPRAVLPALFVALLFIPASRPVAAAANQPDQSRRAADAPPITAVSFLTGTWRGQQGEDHLEETWSEARGGHIQGMFRWMQGAGGPGMMELLSISTEPEGVFLRLRHFDAKLTPWASEAEGPITLKLAPDQSAPNKAVFRGVESEKHLAGVVYDNTAADTLRITITFLTPSDGKPAREPLVITLKSATPHADPR